jgi:endoglucanase
VRQGLAIVRERNPTRLVVVGPTQWNAIGALPGFELPDDDHLVVTIHYYDPFYFTHQGAEWLDPPLPADRIWTGSQLAPAAGWRDWSWSTGRDYAAELTVTYEGPWAGLYLVAVLPVTDATHLALRTSRALDLFVRCSLGEEGAVPVRTEAGVELVVEVAACGGEAGVGHVMIQNATDAAQPPFVLETLELRGPAGARSLFATETEALEGAFDLALAWAEANGGRPVYLGEFGAYGPGDLASRVRWTRAVRDAAEARGFGWGYWEFGAGFGAYDQAARAWRPELLEALVGD